MHNILCYKAYKQRKRFEYLMAQLMFWENTLNCKFMGMFNIKNLYQKMECEMRVIFHFYKNNPKLANDFFKQLYIILTKRKSLMIVIILTIFLMYFILQ